MLKRSELIRIPFEAYPEIKLDHLEILRRLNALLQETLYPNLLTCARRYKKNCIPPLFILINKVHLHILDILFRTNCWTSYKILFDLADQTLND